MPNIVKRPLAKKDMKGIWKYIADDSADRATQFLRLLESKMEILANTPLMGRACDELMLDTPFGYDAKRRPNRIPDFEKKK